jgi:hypothetical protein
MFTSLEYVPQRSTLLLPVHLMPKTFTLSQLHRVYEQVLGTSLEPTDGASRSSTCSSRLSERAMRAPHRPAQPYRIKRRYG